MGKLDGKTALITGGSSGIGFATARLFIAEGAHVFITGRSQHGLDDAAAALGPSSAAVQSDVTNLTDLDRLFARITQEKQKLDIVFANAGLGLRAPLGAIDEQHFDMLFDCNVKGLLFTVQGALPLIPEGGSIILNGSISGSKGFPSNSVYAATKAATRSFARTWTTDLKTRRIRVNTISFGAIDTEGRQKVIGSSPKDQARIKTAVESMTPMGRIAGADEAAKAVLFLASDDSSYITGTELFVDGGTAQV